MEKYYVREYIPGYTGHISSKLGTFGITAGEINRRLILKQNSIESVPREKLYYTKSQADLLTPDKDRIKFGNRSRYGISWISGPTDKVFDQHIPLYQGHVPSIIAENITAKSFARCTKTAIEGNRPKGFDVPNADKYRTTYTKNFSEKKNRRYYAEPAMVGVARDIHDFHNLGGDIEPRPQTVAGLSALAPIAERDHRASMYDFVSTKAKWVNRDMSQTNDFARLSTGFQKVILGNEKQTTIPVAGYRGFMPGYHAHNMHGKSFRELAVQSKRFAALTQKPQA